MKILVDDIPFEGLHVDLTSSMEGMADALQTVSFGDAPVKLTGTLDLLPIQNSPAIHGSGRLVTTVKQQCGRCLEAVDVSVEEKFQLMLQPDFGVPEDEEEIDLTPESLDISVFGEDGIDVPDIVREQVLLCLPIAVLCKTSCKGICQRCGAELNSEPCRCDSRLVDPRFAVLKDLKVSD